MEEEEGKTLYPAEVWVLEQWGPAVSHTSQNPRVSAKAVLDKIHLASN